MNAREEIARLRAWIDHIESSLAIPAAEYVPAIGDVFLMARAAREGKSPPVGNFRLNDGSLVKADPWPDKSSPPPAAARTEEVECDTRHVAAPMDQIGEDCLRALRLPNGQPSNCPGTLRAKAALQSTQQNPAVAQMDRAPNVSAPAETYVVSEATSVGDAGSTPACGATPELRAKAQAVRLVCGTCGNPPLHPAHRRAGHRCERRAVHGGISDSDDCPGVLVVASAAEETNA